MLARVINFRFLHLRMLIDGTFPQGTAAYEKRGVAVDVPCMEFRRMSSV